MRDISNLVIIKVNFMTKTYKGWLGMCVVKMITIDKDTHMMIMASILNCVSEQLSLFEKLDYCIWV